MLTLRTHAGSITYLQNQYALLHQLMVMQVNARREHQHIWQQIINPDISKHPAPAAATAAVVIVVAVVVQLLPLPAAIIFCSRVCCCRPPLQLRQHLSNACFQRVDACIAGVGDSWLLLLLTLLAVQPTRCVLQALPYGVKWQAGD